jgi:curved DNA-binding protein CbpA
MDNWYEILGVPEDIKSGELERLESKARLEHHPDRHSGEPPGEQARHAAQLKRCLEGVSFLLNRKTRDVLDEHLRAVRATAEAERVRRRNEEEATRRGDADDLRAQFGSKPRPADSTPPSGTAPSHRPSPPQPGPGLPPRPPSPTPSRSAISEADVVSPLDAYPAVDWGGVAGRLGALVASLALLASPFYIMSATGAASNDHLSGAWAIELGCFALLLVGLIAVVCVLGNIFSRD